MGKKGKQQSGSTSFDVALAAAESLGCSRALIYKVLKANGMTPADVIKGKVTV